MRTALALMLVLAAGVGVLWLLLRDEGTPDSARPSVEGEAEPATSSTGPRLRGGAVEPKASTGCPEGRLGAHGRVVDEADHPLAGVEVEVRASPSWVGNRGYHASERYFAESLRQAVERLLAVDAEPEPDAVLTTDDEGRFDYRTEGPVELTFRARVAPPRVSTSVEVTLFENAIARPLVVRVLPGSPIRGRVVDLMGRPLAAQVEAFWRGPDRMRWSRTCTASETAGTFVFEAVPAGRVDLTVTLEGRAWPNLASVATPTDDEILLRLPAGDATLEGRVHDAGDVPVPGALLRLVIERTVGEGQGEKTRAPTLEAAATSDGDGTFVLTELPEGQVTSITAVAAGFRRAELRRGPSWPGIALGGESPATLDLTLRRGSSVKGRVLAHPDDEPLAGATVTLYFLGWAPPQREVVMTDAGGRFRFEGLGTGRFMLLASHPTHYCPELAAAMASRDYGADARRPPATLSFQLGDEDVVVERDLQLVHGGGISGRVEDPSGRPVAGAGVFIRQYGLETVAYRWGFTASLGGDRPPLATSASDGTFLLEGVPPRADWVLYAKKQGTSGRYSSPVAVRADETTEGVVVQVVEGCVVRGRVLDETGRPMPDHAVYVNGPTDLFGGSHRFLTDADGAYEADSLSPASVTLTAMGSEGQRAEARADGLASGEVREGVDLCFGAGQELRGVVVDEEGRPVASIFVHVRDVARSGLTRSARTGRDGTFRIPNVTAARIRVYTFVDRTWVTLSEPMDMPTGELRLVFDRPTRTRLRVRLVGPDDKPIAGAEVRIQAREAGRAGTWNARSHNVTSDEAVIPVDGDPPFFVTASYPVGADGRPLNLRADGVRVVDPTEPVVVRFAAGRVLAGTCRDDEDRPVAGITILVDGKKAISDVDGRWRLVGLRSGTVALEVRPAGAYLAPPVRLVAEDETDVAIVLSKGLPISGRVLVPEGVSIRGGYVRAAWERTADRPAGACSASLTPTGEFRVDGLPPGVRAAVTVHVWPSGSDGPKLAPAVVENVASGTEGLEIRMDEGVVLAGRLVDADGEPVGAGWIWVEGVGDSATAKLDGDGRFVLRALRPGTYRVYHRREDGTSTKLQDVEAPAANVRVQLPGTGTLSGTLSGMEGRAEWHVKAIDTEANRLVGPAPVGRDGRWTISGVATNASWVVIASTPSPDDRYARSDPVPANTAGIALTLARGERIEGRAERDGRAVPGAWVALSASGWRQQVRCDDDGCFTLRGVPPGTYTVTVSQWELRIRGRREEIRAGTTGVVVVLDEDM